MQPDRQSQSQEGDRMEIINLSDVEAARMIIEILLDKGIITIQTAKTAIEKLNGMRLESAAA